jgi:cyclophilin family peptidyl-prolyl cis-trans isomerase
MTSRRLAPVCGLLLLLASAGRLLVASIAPALVAAAARAADVRGAVEQSSRGAIPSKSGPVIVVETSKGTFAFETYPTEAPKTVAHIVDLVKRGFYDGQRIHRAVPGFVVQWGDPRSRDLSQQALWGRGPDASSGAPIGVPEITKKRTHTAGAVAVAHPGLPAQADSQIYVTLANRPDLDGKYTVFGHVVEGEEVPARLERGDTIVRMHVREP